MQLLVRAEGKRVQRPQLVLLDRLAGVVLGGLRRGLGAVFLHLRPGQAQRILRIGLKAVADQSQGAGVPQVKGEPGIGRVAVGRAVVAVTVGHEALHRHVVARRPGAATHTRPGGPAVVAGVGGLHGQFRVLRWRGAPQLDHPAGGVAVQRRERPAQHFHPRPAEQVEVRELALAVGHGRRDAIGIQPDAAHPEGRARTGAADGDLRVLGVVLAVARKQAGHTAQLIGQVDLVVATFAQVHGGDRGRDIEGGHALEPGGHQHPLQGERIGRGRDFIGPGRRAGQQDGQAGRLQQGDTRGIHGGTGFVCGGCGWSANARDQCGRNKRRPRAQMLRLCSRR